MKIEKLKKLSNGKYKIYLNDKKVITTYDDVILKNNLLFHKEIDDDLIDRLEIDNNYYSLYNKCVNMISRRVRSEKEIRDYLSKNTDDINDIEDIVFQLKDIGLLNDSIFASSFVSDKINLSNMGPLKIRKALEDNNIDEEIINNELLRMNEDIIREKVDKYISKKVQNNTKYSSYYLKQKIINDLVNEGYPKDIILDILNNYTITSNIEKEYNKQYKKLINKYSGEELIRNIKNKLFQKGYKKEEIEDVIKRDEF